MSFIKRIPYFGSWFLLVYMPFHVFLSQSLSLITGGLSAWKIGKDILTFGLVLLSIALVTYFKKADNFYKQILFLSGAYLLAHLIIYWFQMHNLNLGLAALATVYNNRLLWYLLIGLSAAHLTPKQINSKRLLKLVLVISSVVCLLGILQYFLPKDILTHFGYSLERGVKPAFIIDDKQNLPRIMSTIRDPNSLGAFLVLPITLLAHLFYKLKTRRLLLGGLLGIHGLTLLLTFSRSAWLATILSLGLLIVLTNRQKLAPLGKKLWLPLALIFIAATGVLYLNRDQYLIQNVILHSDEQTTSQHDSNQLHIILAKQALYEIGRQPQGHGPSTAGPVSIHNPKGSLIPENYYLQIAYEVGLIGLVIMIAALVLVYRRLMNSPSSFLALALLASFWGYVVTNALLHTWSNEAVAVQWWLLAGLSIGLKGRGLRRPVMVE